MKFFNFRNASVMLVLCLATVYLAGCSKTLSGKYSDDSNVMSIDFQTAEKAVISTPLGSINCTYKIDGDTVTFKAEGGALTPANNTLTINSDGSLSGGGLTLKKK